MGWQLGISGEQAMAGLSEYARKIRAEQQFLTPRSVNGIVKSHAVPDGLIEMRREPTDEEYERIKARWKHLHATGSAHRTIALGPLSEITPYQEPPVEAFTECPACHTQHYPFITGHGKVDTFDALVTRVLYVLRECQYCQYRWRQQEPA